MARRLLLCMLFLVAFVSAPAVAHAEIDLPDNFATVTLASGLWDPTAFAYAPDGRIFIAEKRGRVRVVRPGGSQTAGTLIDISGHVATAGDRGLLGIAVDVDFETNHYLYLLYTYDADPVNWEDQKTARLTRITVNPDDTVVSPGNPETVLLGSIGPAPCPAPTNTVDCIPSTSNSHSIGTVRSAPDGTLWVGSGDGSDYNAMDPGALRTLDEESLSGKIIHVDRQGKGLAGHPFCPEDDNLSHVCTKVYAMGFRNPFRFQLRPGGAGPVLGDVGWESYEELDLLSAGGSYGWPCYEGATRTPDYSELPTCQALYAENPPSQSPPVHTYPHSNGGGAIVAGPQYTATRYPAAWRNAWFFGDYVRGWLRAYNIVGGQVTNVRDFAPTGFGGVDLELTPEGDLAYLLFTEGSGQTGRLERIVYGNQPPPAVAHATPAAGASPLHVDFSADESIDPDGDTVTYEWDFGDGSPDATGRTASHTYPDSGVYTARLTVRDARGLASEDTIQVLVDRTPPVAAIEAPANGSLFRNGVPVQLHGSATDLEDGDLAGDALSWHVVLHHGSHTHSQGDLHGADPSFTPPGDHDANSYYEIELTATDSDGVVDRNTVEIHPETVPFTLASVPAGVPLSYSGVQHVAPAKLTAAIGYRTSVAAPDQFTRDGIVYTFKGWSDGGARQHPFVVPGVASTLTATYTGPAGGGTLPSTGGPLGGLPAPPPVTAGGRPAPRLRLDRPRRRARVLTGRITGLATAPRVAIALRTPRVSGRCRHWHAGRGGLGRRVARCSTHVWMRPQVTAAGPDTWRWRLRLGGALKRSRYAVAARVTDRRGRALITRAAIALHIR